MDEWVTIPRLEKLLEHWTQYPPVHITAALFAGVKSERVAARAQARAEAANDRKISNADLVRDMPVRAQSVKWIARANG